MIDHAYPENLGWDFECDMPSVVLAPSLPDDSMSILYRGMQNVKTPADWQTIIEAAKTHNGNIALLQDN